MASRPSFQQAVRMPTARTTSTVILSSPVLSTTDDGAAPREEHWDVPSSDSSIPDIKSLIKKTKKINAQKAPTETGLANEELAEAVAAPKKRGRPKKVSDDVVQEGGSVKAAPKKRTTKKTTEMATGGKRTTGSKKKEKAAAESRFFDKLPKTKAGAATKAKGTKEEPIVLDEKTPPPRRRRDWTPVTDTIPAAPVTPKEDFSTTSPVGSGSEGSTSSVEKRKASLLDKLDGYRFSGTLSTDKTPVATPLKGTIKRRKIGVRSHPSFFLLHANSMTRLLHLRQRKKTRLRVKANMQSKRRLLLPLPHSQMPLMGMIMRGSF